MPDQGWPAAAARSAVPAGCRAGLVRWRGVSFFICQSQPDQNVVDGGQGAGQPRGGTQFLEGQIGLFSQQCPQLVLMAGDNAGLAARAVMLGAEVAQAMALLEEFLDHAQRNPETTSHRLASALVGVVSGQNPFPQIQGDGFHAASLPQPKRNGCSFVSSALVQGFNHIQHLAVSFHALNRAQSRPRDKRGIFFISFLRGSRLKNLPDRKVTSAAFPNPSPRWSRRRP